MAPAVAERDAAQLQSRRPDRARAGAAAASRMAGARQASALSGGSASGRTARPGARHRRARTLRACAATVEPRRRSRSARPCRPASGLAALDLEVAAQRRRWSDAASAAASARRGRRGSDENAPAANMARLASASPSDRPTDLAAGSVAIGPARSGAGIEQDADDGEVEGRARPLARIAPCGCPVDLVPAIAARRPRSAASARGRARRARDRPRAWSRRPGRPPHRGGRDRRGNARSPSCEPDRQQPMRALAHRLGAQ